MARALRPDRPRHRALLGHSPPPTLPTQPASGAAMYPAHVDSKKRRSEQRRRLRRAAPAQQAGANRIIAVAVARATSTCRPRTSVRPSERETVPLDARRRVASLGATAERVGLGVNSYRDARRPTTGSSRRSALGTCLLGRQHVRLPQPNQRTAANKAYNSFWVPSRFIFWVGLAA